MKKKLVLPDNDLSIVPEDAGFNQRLSYESILESSKVSVPRKDLENSIKKFEEERQILNTAIKKSLPILRDQSLLTVFLIWSKGNLIREGYPDYPKMLLEKNILTFEDKKGHLLIIKNLKEDFFYEILEKIRCKKDLDIWSREMLILELMDFLRWLWAITLLSSCNIKDRDRERTVRRELDYNSFITFLGKLDERCQLVAKLLYFGGSRTLTEILNLEIKDVDFWLYKVHFGSLSILYPLHVFEDIKALSRDQKTGKIFRGRNKTSLNPATVFRNFKEASSLLNLDVIYTPKTLTEDV